MSEAFGLASPEPGPMSKLEAAVYDRLFPEGKERAVSRRAPLQSFVKVLPSLLNAARAG